MFETWLKNDLKKPIKVEQLHGNLFSGDNEGNKIGVELFDNGAAASVSGSVYGYIIRADGVTVPVNGMLDGNKAYIVLPASAYIVVGQMSIVIKIGDMTVGACTAYVYRTTTDAIVDPGDVVPSLSELLAIIGDCQSATLAANSAASTATSAASSASAAAAAINNMTVSATVISDGLPPTVEISDVDSHKHITFGFSDTSGKANAIEEGNSTPAEVMTFADGAEGMPMKVDVAINPVQDLHGYASPWVGGAGKNLLAGTLANIKAKNTSGTWTDNVYVYNSVTMTVYTNAEGSITKLEFTGTSSSSSVTSFGIYEFAFVSGTQYKLNGLNGGSDSTYRYNIQGVANYTDGDNTITGDGSTHNVRVQVIGNASTGFSVYPMLRLATETDATFAPYTNLCPISGWDAVEITRMGKNLFDTNHLVNLYSNANFSSMEATADKNGVIIKTTSSASGSPYVYIDFMEITSRDVGRTFTLSCSPQGFTPSNDYAFATCASDGSNRTGKTATYTIAQADVGLHLAVRLYGVASSPSTSFVYNNVQVEEGSSATQFEPFAGKTYSITLPTTAYGGSLTVNRDGSGKVVVDRVSVKFSDASWTRSVSGGLVSYKYSATGKKNGYATVISSAYRTGTSSSDAGEGTITGRTSNTNVFIVDSRFESTDDWLADVGNETLVYELATATEYTLTAQQIRSLLGENSIWADSGNVLSVVYYADTKMYIDNLFSTIVNGTGVSF